MIEPAVEPRGWRAGHKLGFRFACIYLLLYNLPFPAGWLPKTQWLADAWGWPFEKLYGWVGDAVFGVTLDFGPNGSGDTTTAWVGVFTMFVLAAIGALAWTALDRRRVDYRRLDAMLRVYVRYVLGLTMLIYGFAKVFKTQFPFPTEDSLQETYGESSPMGLLWRMMGYSTGYNLFTGGVEVMGGLLLLWRRTALLGAVVSAGALTNIVVLNLCYDVPVKQYSAHLLLMSVYVMAPDLGRLAALFVLDRPIAPRPPRPPLTRRRAIARWIVKYGVIGFALYSEIDQELDARRMVSGDDAPPIVGVYTADTVVVDGKVAPPLLTNGPRWRTVAVNAWSGVMVRHVDGSSERFGGAFDRATHLAVWQPYTGGAPAALLYAYRPGPGKVTLFGVAGGHPMIVLATKKDPQDQLLVSRGFHWINEAPFNR